MQPRWVQIVLSATSLFSVGWRLTSQNPSLPAGVRLNDSSTVLGMLNASSLPTRHCFLGSFSTLGPKKSWNMASDVATQKAVAPHPTIKATLSCRRVMVAAFAARPATARMRSAIEGAGAYPPPTASIAIRRSGGASLGKSTARTMSSAWITSGLLRTVVASPADCDGLTRLVLSRACQRGSGGAIGAGALAGAWATPAAGADADAVTSWPAQGAGPATSTVSNLITSTGQPSAATMIDGVSGLRKSAPSAGGRITHVCSWTSKTS